MFKVNNKDTTPERRHWRRSSVFIVNFEHILIVNFEHVIAGWAESFYRT